MAKSNPASIRRRDPTTKSTRTLTLPQSITTGSRRRYGLNPWSAARPEAGKRTLGEPSETAVGHTKQCDLVRDSTIGRNRKRPFAFTRAVAQSRRSFS